MEATVSPVTADPSAAHAVSLTKSQQRRLAVLERTIQTGMKTFVAVGRALQEIRDTRLYMASHATFAEYVEDRWHFTPVRANQLMSAAKVVQRTVEATGIDIPSERVARSVARLELHQGRAVAHQALRLAAKSGELTEEAVEAAAASAAPVSKDSTQVYLDMLRGYLRAIVKLPAPEGVDPKVAGRRGELAKALTKCLTEFFAD